MTRKYSGGLLVAAFALVLASCATSTPPSGTDTGATSEAPAPAEPTTLTVTTWSRDEAGFAEWWAELKSSYEASHENVTLDVQQVGINDYNSTLTARFAGGQPPDVVHVPLPLTYLPAWAEGGFLTDLGEFMASEGLDKTWPESQSEMEWNDTTYGLVVVDYGMVLFYNDQLLKEAGVAVPTTPDELLAAAAAVTKGDKYGMSIVGDTSYAALNLPIGFLVGTGTEYVKDGAWAFGSPEVVAQIDKYRKLAKQSAPAGLDEASARQVFIDGNAAFMLDGPFFFTAIQNGAAPELLPDLHIGQLPFEHAFARVSSGFSISAGVPAEKTELAKDFLRLIASQEKMEFLAKSAGTTVALRAANQVLDDGTPDGAAVIEAANRAQVMLFPADAKGLRVKWADFSRIAASAINKLLTSEDDTATVLAALDTELTNAGITP